MNLAKWTILLVLCVGTATAQSEPAHPVTQATLQEYFDVCHFATRNREALQIQFDQQKKTLPVWFPMEVWQKMVDAVLALDVTPIALPVYQRYMSEDAARNAIRLFVTPAGQKMVDQVMSKTIDGERAGDEAFTAHQNAIAAQRVQENTKIQGMLAAMTPQQKRETDVFLHSAEWRNLESQMPAVTQEFNGVYLAAQKKAVGEVTQSNKAVLQKAFQDYKKAHPDAGP